MNGYGNVAMVGFPVSVRVVPVTEYNWHPFSIVHIKFIICFY